MGNKSWYGPLAAIIIALAGVTASWGASRSTISALSSDVTRLQEETKGLSIEQGRQDERFSAILDRLERIQKQLDELDQKLDQLK